MDKDKEFICKGCAIFLDVKDLDKVKCPERNSNEELYVNEKN